MFKQEFNDDLVFLSLRLLLSFFLVLGLIAPSYASNTTYYATDYNVSNGTYLSGSVPASLQTVDSDYFVVESSPSATSGLSYYPASHTPIGSTAYVAGAAGDLVSDNNAYMVYRSGPSVLSAQSLYAHQEATMIAGSSYYTQKSEPPDLTGMTLSASMSTIGRQLLGRFTYPLSGLRTIPASTWTGFYRTWKDADPSISYVSVGSADNGDGASNITWNHIVGMGANRFMVIGVAIKTVTVSVSNVTVGGQQASFLRSDVRGSEIRGEVWYLINPSSGSKTITVMLSDVSKADGGSVSYTGVDQTDPIDNHRVVSYGGTNPSISLTTTANNEWIFSNLAISGTATVNAHGSLQVHRYYEVGTGGSGSSRAGNDGDDTLAAIPNSYTMSWNMSFYSDVIAQAVALKPAPPPIGHLDIDILVLKSDGAIRTTIAANAANSADLTTMSITQSGTYSLGTYTVVDQTDYLEVDYYVEVTASTSGTAAYLRIDDNSLPATDQTKLNNIILPSEYTAEVEFSGQSDTFTWTQVDWTMETSWTTGSVTATLQLYDYSLGRYASSGDGFIAFTTGASADTDETKTQMVNANPQLFRNTTGFWKAKVKGVKVTGTPFDLKTDWVDFRPTHYSEYVISTEFIFTSLSNDSPTQLGFTLASEYNIPSVPVAIQVWNVTSSAYVESGEGYLRYTSSSLNETRALIIDTNPRFYTANGGARVRVVSLANTTIQYQQRTNLIKLDCDYTGTSPWPSGWFTTFLYVVPIPIGLMFLWFFGIRRKKRDPKVATVFSEQFGMTHEQMLGKKMLLEIDPASDYNVALSGFVSEAKNRDEAIYIVTNRNSALHSVFSQIDAAEFLILTSKTHYPLHVSDRETLLPASDLSLLLDTCVKTQEAQPQKTLNLLFDNVSDIILRCGFDQTYKFTRLLLEALSSSGTTALFVFIPTAHEQEVSSSFRGLFHTQLTYTKDGPKTGNT